MMSKLGEGAIIDLDQKRFKELHSEDDGLINN